MASDKEQELQYFFTVLRRIMGEYIDLRLAMMCRVKPSLRGQVDDLIFHIKAQIDRVLLANRVFGGTRLSIIALLIGDQRGKVKEMLTATDQNTMINDFIDREDEGGKKTASTLAVNDLRSLYGRLDPSLRSIIETLQAFSWMDLPDVIDTANAEISIKYLMEILKQRAVPENIKRSVNRQLNRPEDRELALEEALLTHYHRIRLAVRDLTQRRRDESPFAFLIRRDLVVREDDAANQLVMKCATHLHNAHQLRQAKALNDEQKAAYGKAMGVAAEGVTPEQAVLYEHQVLNELRGRLAVELQRAAQSMEPVDQKRAQLRDIQSHFERIAAALKQAGVDLEKPAPVPNPFDE